MLRTFLTVLIIGLVVFAIPSRIYALDSSDPCPFYVEGCAGGGTGSPSNEGGSIPEREGPSAPERGENEPNKPKRPSVRTFGRRTSSTLDTKPPMSICERAQYARGRNSPTAPGLEARCQATKH
jgi:hypothetical protein